MPSCATKSKTKTTPPSPSPSHLETTSPCLPTATPASPPRPPQQAIRERFEMVGVVELLHAALVYQTRPNHQSAFSSQHSSRIPKFEVLETRRGLGAQGFPVRSGCISYDAAQGAGSLERPMLKPIRCLQLRSSGSSHPAQKLRPLSKTKGLPSDSLGNAQ
jgi:hypothetical protein